MHSLGASLPVIFPGQAEQKAAYRLLSNDGVTMEPILDSHTEQTVERCGTEPLVLAIQDTTTLNDDARTFHDARGDATEDLDANHPMTEGGWRQGRQGSLAPHPLTCGGITVNAVGRPLGLFMAGTDDGSGDFRQASPFHRGRGKDSRRWVQGLERAGELARACPPYHHPLAMIPWPRDHYL